MQKKDIIPTPSTSKASNQELIKKELGMVEQDSLVHLVPPPKKLIKEDTPLTNINKN